MSGDEETFKVSRSVEADCNKATQAMDEFGRALVAKLVVTRNMKTIEAASVVAFAMISASWCILAGVRRAEFKVPKRSRFRAVVESVLDRPITLNGKNVDED